MSVVIAPGLNNSGQRHWQSYWQRQLPDAVRAEQANWAKPDLLDWADCIAERVRAAGPSWIVAHSFGCLASVMALSQVPELIQGLFLAAPADPRKFGVENLLPKTQLAVPGIVVGSLSDPWLKWEQAEQWASRWQLPLVCAGVAGHINIDSGHGRWQAGWQLFRRLREGRLQTAATRQWIAVAV